MPVKHHGALYIDTEGPWFRVATFGQSKKAGIKPAFESTMLRILVSSRRLPTCVCGLGRSRSRLFCRLVPFYRFGLAD